jgi:hypothetical protein
MVAPGKIEHVQWLCIAGGKNPENTHLPGLRRAQSQRRVLEQWMKNAEHVIRNSVTNVFVSQGGFPGIFSSNNIDDLVQAESFHRRESTQKMPPVEGIARGGKYSQAKRMSAPKCARRATTLSICGCGTNVTLVYQVSDTSERGSCPILQREKCPGICMITKDFLHKGNLAANPPLNSRGQYLAAHVLLAELRVPDDPSTHVFSDLLCAAMPAAAARESRGFPRVSFSTCSSAWQISAAITPSWTAPTAANLVEALYPCTTRVAGLLSHRLI